MQHMRTRGCCAAATRLGELLGVARHESDAQRSRGCSGRHRSAPRAAAQARSADACRQQRRREEHARAACAVRPMQRAGRHERAPPATRRRSLTFRRCRLRAWAPAPPCVAKRTAKPLCRSSFPCALKARNMAMAPHTRYTRRRSPDTLALLIAAVLACLLCQAGWSAAFGDGLPQLDVGPRRRLLREFTPLQKVRRGAAAAAAPARAVRGGGGDGPRAGAGRFSRPCIPVAPGSGHLFASPRGARPRRRVRPVLRGGTSRVAIGSRRSARPSAALRPFPRRSVCGVP